MPSIKILSDCDLQEVYAMQQILTSKTATISNASDT